MLPVVLLAGCFDFSEPTGEIALDYRVDRPRVLAVRVQPPYVQSGEPVRIEALAWAPGGVDATVTAVEICGLRDDITVLQWGPDCFQNPELIERIATSTPVTWTPPDLGAVPCLGPEPDTAVDTGVPYDVCASRYPLMVTAEHGGVQARALLTLTHYFDVLPITAAAPDPTTVPFEVVADGPARAGHEVRLVARYLDPTWAGRFAWYVDAGELAKTGQTAVQALEPSAAITDNVLRIPEDHPGGPLRVAVVVLVPSWQWEPRPGRVAVEAAHWATTTLEVVP